jgi:hypothetical protein
MLERGKRRLTPGLARKAVRVYGLAPTALPPKKNFSPETQLDPQKLAENLAVLQYPGFQYLHSHVRQNNPAEVLLSGLNQKNLEARLGEAMFWLPLQYWDMDAAWLVEHAKLHDLQNRLGFVVTVARRVSERLNSPDGDRTRRLQKLEAALNHSRLDREDFLFQAPRSDEEKKWLVENRTEDAKHWKLLTDWRPEHLQYAG